MPKIVTRVLLVTYTEDDETQDITLKDVREQRPNDVVELPIKYLDNGTRGVILFRSRDDETGCSLLIIENKF
jgi:hypothetical protein